MLVFYITYYTNYTILYYNTYILYHILQYVRIWYDMLGHIIIYFQASCAPGPSGRPPSRRPFATRAAKPKTGISLSLYIYIYTHV